MKAVRLEDYEYLWLGPTPAGALILLEPASGESKPQYCIGDRKKGTIVLIEVEAIAEAVKQEMLRHGVPIIPSEEF